MKSLAVIKTIIPTLSAIKGGGVFSNPVASIAGSWSVSLVEAGKADKIDLGDIAAAVDRLKAANAFEAQQIEVTACLGMLEALLDDIPAGKLPEYVAPAETMEDVQQRLYLDIATVMDTFRPTADKMASIRRDAALFANMVKGSVCHRELPDDCDQHAEMALDLIDRGLDSDYTTRRRLFARAEASIKKIAA